MIFKIFGKTNNKFSKWICNETVNKIKEKSADSEVQFFDMDKPLGKDIAAQENIFYVPTIICEDDEDLELGYLENNSCCSLENDDAIHDINLSGKWWMDLEKFMDDVIVDSKRFEEKGK